MTDEERAGIADIMARIEERALALRKTMSEVCREASIGYSTWWRAKKGKEIRLETLDKLETALKRLENTRAETHAKA